jgi:PIN domain nuclease of toxin-antitoxin system
MSISIISERYIVDTHALIWYLEGNPRLGQQAKQVLADVESKLILPIIVLAESVLVIDKKRTAIPSASVCLTRILQDQRIEICDLTLPIFQRSLTEEGLRVPELHDRLIVSTGLYLQDLGYAVAILTRDEEIVQAGVLPVIW